MLTLSIPAHYHQTDRLPRRTRLWSRTQLRCNRWSPRSSARWWWSLWHSTGTTLFPGRPPGCWCWTSPECASLDPERMDVGGNCVCVCVRESMCACMPACECVHVCVWLKCCSVFRVSLFPWFYVFLSTLLWGRHCRGSFDVLCDITYTCFCKLCLGENLFREITLTYGNKIKKKTNNSNGF